MKIRPFACTVAITGALTASLLSAPLASAAQLTITDDVCTTTWSEAEVVQITRLFKESGQTLIAELKKVMPSVAADIDAVTSDEGVDNSGRMERINVAGVAAGLGDGEAELLLFTAWVLINSEPLSDVGEPETITRQEAAESLSQGNDNIWLGDVEQTLSTPGRAVLTKAVAIATPLLNLEKTLLQACVDGEPGTYNLNTGGGGGGNTDLPGSSGSSGFSFGSS